MPEFLQSLREQNQLRSEKWTGGADTTEFKAVELAGETGELMNAIKNKFASNRVGKVALTIQKISPTNSVTY